MQQAKRNPEIQRHAAEKLDEVNQARFRREKGILPSRPSHTRRPMGSGKPGSNKVSF